MYFAKLTSQYISYLWYKHLSMDLEQPDSDFVQPNTSFRFHYVQGSFEPVTNHIYAVILFVSQGRPLLNCLYTSKGAESGIRQLLCVEEIVVKQMSCPNRSQSDSINVSVALALPTGLQFVIKRVIQQETLGRFSLAKE